MFLMRRVPRAAWGRPQHDTSNHAAAKNRAAANRSTHERLRAEHQPISDLKRWVRVPDRVS
jgi:hypothetical protein